MSKDPWLQAINAFEPDTPILRSALIKGPKIIVELTKAKNAWAIQIKEVWPDPVSFSPFEHNELKTCIDWVDSQLCSWGTCKRTSYDKWSFSSKKDAEKFITFFNIRWAQ